jgi:hypothetical protein
MRFAATALAALFVTTSAVASDRPPLEPLHYIAHVQLRAGSALVADKSVELVDRRSFTLQGTAKDNPAISYNVKLTPYVVTDGRVGLDTDLVVKTQGPTRRFTSGGKTLFLPSSTTCSSTPKAILAYNTPTKVVGGNGDNGDGHVLQGCEIIVTLSKP